MHRGALGALVTTILSLVPAIAGAQVETEPIGGELARARTREARADFAGAAAAYERYARRCLASATAVLRAGHPCAATAEALARAFELRRALGEPEAADAHAATFAAHFLYARPRRALRIAHARARLHLAGGRLERAEAAIEHLAALHPDPPPAQAILVDALRARLAAARGRARRAARHWRRVERRWARQREAPEAHGAVPRALVREAVAEGRLARADALVERFLATRPPRVRRIRNDRAWWRRTMSPWLVRARRRLLLARLALERVYELGSPRHSVVAAARIGEMYAHRAELHAALTLPSSEWVRMLVDGGADRPGYEQARHHLEACVRWSRHHGVAPRWGARCEERLHHLDPERYPRPAELHGTAAYRPAARARPAEPRP